MARADLKPAGIDGISASTAQIVLTEIGSSVTSFPSEDHFVSWLRLCPAAIHRNLCHCGSIKILIEDAVTAAREGTAGTRKR